MRLSNDCNITRKRQSERERGVKIILRAFNGQQTLSGLYYEDLEAVAERHTENTESCEVQEYEKPKRMFAMLLGSARTLFNRNGKQSKTFTEGQDLL